MQVYRKIRTNPCRMAQTPPEDAEIPVFPKPHALVQAVRIVQDQAVAQPVYKLLFVLFRSAKL